jgi:predicted transcriptional regulator
MTPADTYQDIGSLQIRVLRILWRRGDGTVHEVLQDFPKHERPAYTTVLHVLRTLERRGLVAHVQQARQYRYRPLVDADDVEAGAVRSLLARVFAGSAERLVARLLDSAPLEPQELESIQRLIAEREADLPSAEKKQ